VRYGIAGCGFAGCGLRSCGVRDGGNDDSNRGGDEADKYCNHTVVAVSNDHNEIGR
jgi:hypothetical protein